MGQEFFKRQWAVTVDTIRTTTLDISFKIMKSLKDEPNKCELSIWNLSEDHRAQIEDLNPATKNVSVLAKKKEKLAAEKEATKGIPCKIEAGYGDDASDLPLLWLGDMRTAHSVRQGSDWITIITSGDGEKAWQNARINVSYGPQTPVATAIRAMVKELGIGEGNLAEVISSVELKGIGRVFPHGTVLSGYVSRLLTDFCRSADLEWSIQDGALQIINVGKALRESAIKITSNSGMLDSPTVDVDGVLTVKMLMPPSIRPGRLLVVDADRIKGNYKAEKIEWSGDTFGDPWEVTIQASRY